MRYTITIIIERVGIMVCGVLHSISMLEVSFFPMWKYFDMLISENDYWHLEIYQTAFANYYLAILTDGHRLKIAG